MGAELSYRDLVKRIPRPLYSQLSEKLMDALLEAKEGEKVPSSITKAILFYWQRDKLASQAGLVNLFEALTTINMPKAESILDEFGLEEVKLELRNVKG